MPAIKLAAFSGERPRVTPRLLPATAARSAINARLDNGALAPYQRPVEVAAIEQDGEDPVTFGTIYLHGSEWLGFPGHVDIAPGPVAADRLYYTGNGKPKLRTGDGTVYDLAVPAPSSAPSGSTSGSGSGDAITRVYVYTFVTDLGEESEPSPPSNEIEWKPGQTVELTGIEDAPDVDRVIVSQRFYRSQTGQVGTDFYFIGERAVSDSNFDDEAAIDEFAEPLPSRYWHAPPNDLRGLVAMPNGMMAAFRGKQLYFCEPYHPHAWPENYVLTTDTPIVALAVTGTTLWVLTESYPYRITGTSPDSMVMEKVEANLPCINAQGVVDLGYAIAWPSNDGLAVARGGEVGIATGNLFAPRDWRKLNPGTMKAGQVEGRWIASYSGLDDQDNPVSGSLIIDVSGDAYQIRTDISGDAWFYDIETGFTYFLNADASTVHQFDSPSGDPAQYYWRSKEFVLPKPDTFGAILIETGAASADEIAARQSEIEDIADQNSALIADEDGVGGDIAALPLAETSLAGDLLIPVPPSLGAGATVNVYADGELIASIGTLDRMARLPSGFRARKWEIDVFSDIEITQITMARTADELKSVASGGA